MCLGLSMSNNVHQTQSVRSRCDAIGLWLTKIHPILYQKYLISVKWRWLVNVVQNCNGRKPIDSYRHQNNHSFSPMGKELVNQNSHWTILMNQILIRPEMINPFYVFGWDEFLSLSLAENHFLPLIIYYINFIDNSTNFSDLYYFDLLNI